MPAFKMPQSADAQLLLAAAVLLVVLYYVGKKTITAAADTVGGVVSGNNAITSGTPYAGWGVAGTLGAAANDASGGVLQNIGNTVGGWAFDLFGPSSTPPAATQVNSAGGGG
jgi:hypothetical protein